MHYCPSCLVNDVWTFDRKIHEGYEKIQGLLYFDTEYNLATSGCQPAIAIIQAFLNRPDFIFLTTTSNRLQKLIKTRSSNVLMRTYLPYSVLKHNHTRILHRFQASQMLSLLMNNRQPLYQKKRRRRTCGSQFLYPKSIRNFAMSS